MPGADEKVINWHRIQHRMTAIVYHDDFTLHDNPYHPERAERLVSVMEYLRSMPFFDRLAQMQPEMVSEDLLLEVHTPDMVSRVKNAQGWLDPDTYVSQDSYRIARLAAGGVVGACQAVLRGEQDSVFALVRPPGHHATRDTSMGFCLFNNAAVAAQSLAKQGQRVLIFDHDVHHGNGTADIFYERRDILYQSFHLYPHFPGTGLVDEIGAGEGAGYTVNAPLSRGTGNAGVRQVMEEVMLPIARQFDPHVVIVSAGFDSHHTDTLGGLYLTVDFYGEIISRLLEVQEKIVCSLEGGYNTDVLRKGVAVEVATLLHTPVSCEDRVEDERGAGDVVQALRDTLGSYWSL